MIGASAPEDTAALRQSLDILVALTLCQMQNSVDPTELMVVLARAKVQPRDIATLLGVSSNAVRVALYRHRNNHTKRKPSAKKAR